MSVKANFERGERYYYVLKATLTLLHFGIPVPDFRLRTEKPNIKGFEFHRVRLEIVRTKKEAAAMNAKLAKARLRNRKLAEVQKKKP